MEKITLKTLHCIFVFLFALHFARPVFAHGEEPRLEISSDRINPGGVIEVRGVDFEREELITLLLVSGTSASPFGEVVADVEGIFLQIVTVPVELQEGTYHFLAITDDHNVTSPDVLIQGPPIVAESEDGQGPRDHEDLLLVPMPTSAPGVIPGDVSESSAQPNVQEAPASNRNPAIFLIIALLVGILVMARFRVARK